MPKPKPLTESEQTRIANVAKRLLYHFGEVVEPLTVARVTSYIKPAILAMRTKMSNTQSMTIARASRWNKAKTKPRQAVNYSRAKYSLILPSKRHGNKLSKKLDKLSVKPIF